MPGYCKTCKNTSRGELHGKLFPQQDEGEGMAMLLMLFSGATISYTMLLQHQNHTHCTTP